MTFTRPQAGPCSCGKYGGCIHELSDTCAFLPCCWGLGGQKLPLGTWDVQSLGSHLLSLPWMGLGA